MKQLRLGQPAFDRGVCANQTVEPSFGHTPPETSHLCASSYVGFRVDTHILTVTALKSTVHTSWHFNVLFSILLSNGSSMLFKNNFRESHVSILIYNVFS